MLKLIYLACLLLSPIWLDAFVSDKMGFSSLEVGDVKFDGQNMLFKGGLESEHVLGTLRAESGRVRFLEEEPVEMILQEGVEIELQEGGHLSAPHAMLDCLNWVAVFHGTHTEKACYAKEKPPFLLKGLRMELQFVKSKERLLLHEMVAQEGVEIKVDDLQLEGDQATFSEFDEEGRCVLAHLISTSDNACRILGEHGEIESRSILLNLKQKNVIVDAPQGLLQKEPPVRFVAATLRVDAPSNMLILSPPIKIDGIGTLSAEGEMLIKRSLEGQFSSLHCDGPAILKIKDVKDGLEHTLKVYGPVEIDHVRMTCLLKSPSEFKQVHLQDIYGEIFADQMILHYQIQEGRAVPVKLFLEGHVKMQNIALGAKQYGLAEKAEFIFATRELILRGSPVLFLDQVNQVQASAPLLRLKRDRESQKDIIQGTGNVRFIFAEEELNELKKRFSIGSER